MQPPETLSSFLSKLMKPESPFFHLLPKEKRTEHTFKLWLEKFCSKDVIEFSTLPSVNLKKAFAQDSIKLSAKLLTTSDPEIIMKQGYIRVGSGHEPRKRIPVNTKVLKEFIDIGIKYQISVVDLGYPICVSALGHPVIGNTRMPGVFIEKNTYPYAKRYGIELEDKIFIPLPTLPELPYCGVRDVLDNRDFKREDDPTVWPQTE